MTDNLFKTGAVMDYVSNAQAIKQDTKSIEDAAVKNSNRVINMPRKTRTIVREYSKIGANEACPCGSGKKYKKCCKSTGKYEHTHELTVLEMAKVKANQMNFADITKDAVVEVAQKKAEEKIAEAKAKKVETVVDETPKKRTRVKRTTKKTNE